MMHIGWRLQICFKNLVLKRETQRQTNFGLTSRTLYLQQPQNTFLKSGREHYFLVIARSYRLDRWKKDFWRGSDEVKKIQEWSPKAPVSGIGGSQWVQQQQLFGCVKILISKTTTAKLAIIKYDTGKMLTENSDIKNCWKVLLWGSLCISGN